MKHFLAVTGNIGAGKTSLARKLAAFFNWELCDEPFTVNPYLENYYKDMAKWSFHCETSFLALRLENHINILKKEHSIIQDRCIYEGAEMFVRYLYKNNLLNETDWQTYHHLYQTTCSLITPPDLIIYIKSSTERCIRNIKQRNRGLDCNVDPAYIADLNKLYEDWEKKFTICPILTADADKFDFKLNEQAFLKLAADIQQKLKLYKLPLNFFNSKAK